MGVFRLVSDEADAVVALEEIVELHPATGTLEATTIREIALGEIGISSIGVATTKNEAPIFIANIDHTTNAVEVARAIDGIARHDIVAGSIATLRIARCDANNPAKSIRTIEDRAWTLEHFNILNRVNVVEAEITTAVTNALA